MNGSEEKILRKLTRYVKLKSKIDRKIKEARVDLRRARTKAAWDKVVIKKNPRKKG